MVLSAKRSPLPDNFTPPIYKMNNNNLELTTDTQDLGVTIDSTLTWNKHIYKIVQKAHARTWLCMRALCFHAYQKAKNYVT